MRTKIILLLKLFRHLSDSNRPWPSENVHGRSVQNHTERHKRLRTAWGGTVTKCRPGSHYSGSLIFFVNFVGFCRKVKFPMKILYIFFNLSKNKNKLILKNSCVGPTGTNSATLKNTEQIIKAWLWFDGILIEKHLWLFTIDL